MNKYIHEKGIILLIRLYAEYCAEDILKIIYKTKDIGYYITAHDKKLNIISSFEGIIVDVICLTNNSFMHFYCTKNESRRESVRSYCINFNKNNKKYYENILKESTTMSNREFVLKYKQIYNGPLVKMLYIKMKRLHKILNKHNIKSYNIKLIYHAWKLIYYCKNYQDYKVCARYKEQHKYYKVGDFFPTSFNAITKYYDNDLGFSTCIHNIN
jgi:hypothetical protein